MNTKWISTLKLLLAASIVVGFCTYVFAPPAIAKQGSPPTTSGDTSKKDKSTDTSNLPRCTSVQQNACRR